MKIKLLKDLIFSAKKLIKAYYQGILVGIIFIVLIFTFIVEVDFNSFLRHPIELTDLDWQIKSVECIRPYLPFHQVVGAAIFASLEEDEPVPQMYQLQYLFAPNVLDITNPWAHVYTVVKSDDRDLLNDEILSGRRLVANCDSLFLFEEE